MNRNITPILLAVALAAGLAVYLSEKGSRSKGDGGKPSGERVLDINQGDILQVRVKRDYWNSYTVRREPDGTWRLTEPTSEPAGGAAVQQLLGTLENLAVTATIDLPAGDTERHREYGLLQPSMEVTLVVGDRERTLLFGVNTADGKGTYCAETGIDTVWVTPSEVVKHLAVEVAGLRANASAASSQPGAAGLKIEDLTTGTGPEAATGQTVSVHYVGRLQDGTEFDSTQRHGGRPFSFKLGAGKVIAGWDQGVVGMRVGGKRRLTIPPEMAYGDKGSPPGIPPRATLTFEIELLGAN